MEQGERRMTKEEFVKEAEEYANNLAFVFETDIVQRIVRERVRLALIDVLEPREKRIAELIALINAERERQEKCDDVHLRTIAELEKENAELKKQLEMSNKVYNDNLDYSHHIEDQLTKAKEIIKKFLDAKSIEETCVAESEAEQFLSEVEK